MRLLALLTLAATFFASGCDSVSSRISERFEGVPPKTRAYQTEEKVVFESAQVALKKLDFQLSRTAIAQGIVDGRSRIHQGETFRDAKQYAIEIRLRTPEPGWTTTEVLIREQQESADFAGATNIALREHGLYDSFFAALEQTLRERGVAVQAPVN